MCYCARGMFEFLHYFSRETCVSETSAYNIVSKIMKTTRRREKYFLNCQGNWTYIPSRFDVERNNRVYFHNKLHIYKQELGKAKNSVPAEWKDLYRVPDNSLSFVKLRRDGYICGYAVYLQVRRKHHAFSR